MSDVVAQPHPERHRSAVHGRMTDLLQERDRLALQALGRSNSARAIASAARAPSRCHGARDRRRVRHSWPAGSSRPRSPSGHRRTTGRRCATGAPTSRRRRAPSTYRGPPCVGEPDQLLDVVGSARRQLASGERLDEEVRIAELLGATEAVVAHRERLVPAAAVHRRLRAVAPATGPGSPRRVPGPPAPPCTTGTRRRPTRSRPRAPGSTPRPRAAPPSQTDEPTATAARAAARAVARSPSRSGRCGQTDLEPSPIHRVHGGRDGCRQVPRDLARRRRRARTPAPPRTAGGGPPGPTSVNRSSIARRASSSANHTSPVPGCDDQHARADRPVHRPRDPHPDRASRTLATTARRNRGPATATTSSSRSRTGSSAAAVVIRPVWQPGQPVGNHSLP